ncbi:MAG: hypothetical protein UW46_C0012G0016 [Candidatus Yanofskybacteria bacterium GW2011_GWF1_44_227]|uniref:Uncharacterized protein n=1 Tax=Candidatus Yanofskybacteria bacterium GW2011_GWE2_40_11 TaxID=1619033 RepID=A0A0G0T0U4_9BACT|nr:MAG: hypothetical protein UT69_C0005G0020 [Candidatus Yanofskybacteria bacterium GW2011_GWE1_40_10]KKR40745.1 MAG: hypothetical protein UT75_C0005G0053 [Candidatus Yanofskybacteria bacterium GW2011_GWE2_40_11]KKT52744.1 MAG: hypothetical protein UW46_C0012G0016 [Candidatus Yanofskybacteria bacterium GW2011_GWF1_44_227]
MRFGEGSGKIISVAVEIFIRFSVRGCSLRDIPGSTSRTRHGCDYMELPV